MWKIVKWKIFKNFLKPYIKMDKKIIKFGYTEIEKQKFLQHKSLISINNVHINKIVVSNKVSFRKKGFEYFVAYKDA